MTHRHCREPNFSAPPVHRLNVSESKKVAKHLPQKTRAQLLLWAGVDTRIDAVLKFPRKPLDAAGSPWLLSGWFCSDYRCGCLSRCLSREDGRSNREMDWLAFTLGGLAASK